MGSVGGLVMDQKVLPITHHHHHHPHLHHHHHHDQQHQQKQQQQQQKQSSQEVLRCPRCDSTNTKFCYYNNYSLSQPRHFCKACKRYWTRGGTLRNVPVGGGCRKNKRVKIKPPIHNSSSSNLTNSTSLEDSAANSANEQNGNNPLFFGINSDMINFPFSSRYDLPDQNPPQIHALGLGFSSSSSSGLVHGMNGLSFNVHNNNKQIFQDYPLISSNYANNNPTTTCSPSPSISSLLASTLQMSKVGGGNNFQTLLPSYGDDLQMKGSGVFVKDVKVELQGQNRNLDHHHTWGSPTQNHQGKDNQTYSDPSLLWGGGAWLDPSNNLGSSVPSLI